MDRTALVTGATGFIGTHLVPALVADGWRVRAAGRRPRPPSLPPEVGYTAVDLAGGPDLDDVLGGCAVVFHLAGASSSRSDEAQMHRDNVMATEHLLDAARRAGVGLVVHMSSTSVYGEEVQLPQPVPEDVEPRPSRGYGKAKWITEQVVWRHAAEGLPVVVLRPVTVYGPGNTKLLASALLDAAIERHAGVGALAVHSQPIEQRLVHVSDLVAATLHVATCDAAPGRAFNVCLPSYPTSHEVAGHLAGAVGLPLVLDDDPDCGLAYEDRAATRERMLAAGMAHDILLTRERFRFIRKANRNNRLSVDALTGTGFVFARTDLEAGIAGVADWYRRRRWIL